MSTSSKVVFAGLIGVVTMTTAQTTYEKDVAPIIQKHCVSCHSPGGYGPFSLESFSDVFKRAKFIGHVTETRYMPPWKADPTFSRFANERF
ncbi:MAG: c-type cytochrome, partial [Flavobacteriaceae bacterium]